MLNVGYFITINMSFLDYFVILHLWTFLLHTILPTEIVSQTAVRHEG